MFVEREKKEKKEAGDFERQLKFFFLVDEQKVVEDIINDFRCNHF